MSSDESNDNRREFSRVDAHPDAVLSTSDGKQIATGKALDISMSGLFLDATADITAGAEVQVMIPLDTSQGLAVNAHGHVIRIDSHGIAIEFDSLDDTESYGHLRNLVLYNSAETQGVEEEIRSHSGISRRPHD